jgi:hypothetical protein|tara:strand:- start:660 stop:866 length:207 start_codon:yes stop_codon:yes gene_type:complete
MEPYDFYHTKRYCPKCRDYVRFLQSLKAAYCVDCGARVRLFNPQDKKAFAQGLAADKKKPRAPKKRVS